MKLWISAAALSLILSGCAAPVSQTKPAETKPAAPQRTGAEVFSDLWEMCQSRHLKYQISCDDAYGCNGYAWDNRLNWSEKKEYWISHSEPPSDPTAAAERLLSVLHGQANAKDEHKRFEMPRNTFDTGEVKP